MPTILPLSLDTGVYISWNEHIYQLIIINIREIELVLDAYLAATLVDHLEKLY